MQKKRLAAIVPNIAASYCPSRCATRTNTKAFAVLHAKKQLEHDGLKIPTIRISRWTPKQNKAQRCESLSLHGCDTTTTMNFKDMYYKKIHYVLLYEFPTQNNFLNTLF